MSETTSSALHPVTDGAGTWVSTSQRDRHLTVAWPDGQESTYHFVWLRHAARCPGGMPNDAINKLELLPDDPATLALRGMELEDGTLKLRWTDGRLVTEHALGDLKAAAYDDDQRVARSARPRLWDREAAGEIPVIA